MALPTVQSFVGQFTTNAAANLAPQTIGGLVDANGDAFTPSVVVFFLSPDGFQDLDPLGWWRNTYLSMGFDNLSTAVSSCRNSAWNFAFDVFLNANTGSSSSYSITNLSISISAARFVTEAKLGAVGLGNFTINYATNELGEDPVGFLALGGAGLHSFIGVDGWVPSEHKSITGVGFKPTAGIFMASGIDGVAGASARTPGFGVIDGDLRQCSMAAYAGSKDNLSPPPDHLAAAARYQSNTAVVSCVQQAFPSIAGGDAITVTSWNADGFSAQATDQTYLTTYRTQYLLLGGVKAFVGEAFQPSGGVNTNFAAPEVLPVAMMVGSTGSTNTAIEADYRLTLGLSDMIRMRGVYNGVQNNGWRDSAGGAYWGSGAEALLMAQPNGVHSTNAIVQGQMAITGSNIGSVDGTWTGSDGTARRMFYIVLGAAPPGALPPGCVINMGVGAGPTATAGCSTF